MSEIWRFVPEPEIHKTEGVSIAQPPYAADTSVHS